MIANLIVGGLAAGCLYAMVGIAIVIVLNITDIANFAQGEMAMLTTFFAYSLMESGGLPWWQAVSVALVFGLVQGIVIQQVVIRPLIGGPVLSAIIATLGLNIVLNSVAGLIWGHQTYTFPSPFAFSPPFLIGGVPVSVDSVVNIAVGLVLIIAMTLFLRYTWTGLEPSRRKPEPDGSATDGCVDHAIVRHRLGPRWLRGRHCRHSGGALAVSRYQPDECAAHQGFRRWRSRRPE